MGRPRRSDRVLEALKAVRAVLAGLTPAEKEEAEFRLFVTRGYFDRYRDRMAQLAEENARMEWKLRGRRTKPDATRERDMQLAREKQSKSWSKMFADHPEMNRETLRSAVYRGERYLGIRSPVANSR